MGGETVTISKMSYLSVEAGLERKSFNLDGAKSDTYMPLSVGRGPAFVLLERFGLRESEGSRPRFIYDAAGEA